jgi:membrane protein
MNLATTAWPAQARLPLPPDQNAALYSRIMRWRVYFALIGHAGRAWIDDGAPSMGAALAFYSAFSIAPLLIIVIGIAGAVYGVDVARGAVQAQLAELMGPTAAAAIQSLLMGARGQSTGVIASLIGVVTLLVGATTVLVELQTDLDRIWSAPSRKGYGVVTLLRSHITSLGLILCIGFLLLVSLVLTGTLALFGKNWGSVYPGVATALFVLNFLLSLAVITALIAILYKWLPNVTIAWGDVWIGALTTAILFIAGQTAIGFYLTQSAMGSAYGAAGAMVVLLTWLYYSAQIFLFGAEFTQAYANRCAAIGMDCLSKEGASAADRAARIAASPVEPDAREERVQRG